MRIDAPEPTPSSPAPERRGERRGIAGEGHPHRRGAAERGLVVSAEVTPGTRLTAISAC
jgi:hypothetical protein